MRNLLFIIITTSIFFAQQASASGVGEVSQSIAEAFKSQSSASLLKISNTKVLAADVSTDASFHPVDPSELFQRVNGCEIVYFDDPNEDYRNRGLVRAEISWACPDKVVLGRECYKFGYGAYLRIWKRFGPDEAFYFYPTEEYDAEKCSPPRPYLPGEAVE